MKMAEKEQGHRINCETSAPKASVREATRGHLLSFIVTIVCIGSAIYLAISGREVAAGILAGTCAVSLVGRSYKGAPPTSRIPMP